LTKKGAIFVDFYPGAYGPTLIIIIDEIEELVFFKTLISKLCNNNTNRLSLHEYEKFNISGISDLVLEVSNNRHSEIKVTKERIVLYGTKDTWETCCCLVDALIKTSSGHQYFERYFEYDEDIVVELSYKENLKK